MIFTDENRKLFQKLAVQIGHVKIRELIGATGTHKEICGRCKNQIVYITYPTVMRAICDRCLQVYFYSINDPDLPESFIELKEE